MSRLDRREREMERQVIGAMILVMERQAADQRQAIEDLADLRRILAKLEAPTFGDRAQARITRLRQAPRRARWKIADALSEFLNHTDRYE